MQPPHLEAWPWHAVQPPLRRYRFALSPSTAPTQLAAVILLQRAHCHLEPSPQPHRFRQSHAGASSALWSRPAGSRAGDGGCQRIDAERVPAVGRCSALRRIKRLPSYSLTPRNAGSRSVRPKRSAHRCAPPQPPLVDQAVIKMRPSTLSCSQKVSAWERGG